MPVILVISSAVRDWLSGLIIGIPPPTDASNIKLSLLSLAIPRSSEPCAATSALLDVHTLFPASSAFLTNVNAGSTPPITSTTTSISGSFIIRSIS